MPVEDKIVKLQLWDTAGQERFRTIVSSYYRGTNGVMVVYDVTNAKSFEAVGIWYQEVTRYARANVPVLLVGNKADAGDSNRQVSTSQGEDLAARLGMTFVETSAKTARGVQEAFHSIASQIKTEMETSRLGNINKTLGCCLLATARPTAESWEIWVVVVSVRMHMCVCDLCEMVLLVCGKYLESVLIKQSVNKK